MAKKIMNVSVDKIPANKKKKDETRIVFLLDRSMSMMRIREEAVSGFNQYLSEQKKAEGEAKISLYFFDNKIKEVYRDVDVSSAREISVANLPGEGDLEYRPQGMTSLFDSIHAVIDEFISSPKSEKVIFAILTDGDDTSSQKHTHSSVSKAIEEAQCGGWEVLFLGANMNAGSFASSIGVKASNVAQFDATGKGIRDAIDTMAFASSYYRGDTTTVSKAAASGVGGQSLGGAVSDIDLHATLIAVASGKIKVGDGKK